LNLATNPVRNRRFFYLLQSILLVALLVISSFSGILFMSYQVKAKSVRSSLADLDRLTTAAQHEERKYETENDLSSKKLKKTVDLVNTIILKKSFSWVELLSQLENALPDSSYILSLSPKIGEDTKVELTFRVASPNIQELVQLINNLKDLNFHQIKVMSEARDERGQLVSEIYLKYERTV